MQLMGWLQENIDCSDPISIYIYGFNFSGSDRDYLRHILDRLKPSVKAIKVCDCQAKSIKNKQENNLKDNIKKFVDIYNNYGRIEFVDFEGNSL